MAELKVPLAVGDKTAETAEWVSALAENVFFVPKAIRGSEGYLSSMPEIALQAIGPSNPRAPDRGGIFVERSTFRGHYRVMGNNLVIVPTPAEIAPQVTVIGEIFGVGKVSMAYSFNNLAIVADKKLYYYNPSDGLRQITDPDVGGPIDITWGDNLFILTDGENIYHSDPLDEENFLTLDFATAEFRPDPSLGVAFNEDSELLVFGTKSIEYYRNVGAQDFVFQRITQKAQKIGIVDVHAKGEFGNSYYMLGGRDNTSIGAYVTEGGISRKISSIAVDKILSDFKYSDLSQAIVESIDLEGVVLAFFHLPEFTLLFNRTLFDSSGGNLVAAEAAWTNLFSVNRDNYSERLPYDAVNFVRDPDQGEWLFGSKQFDTVNRYNFLAGSEFGAPQEITLYTPLLKLESVSINSFECETVSGYGNTPQIGSDETRAFISLTYDGVVWGKEWSLRYGLRNDHNIRFIINRLGTCNNYVGFRIRINSRTRVAFAVQATLDVS